jgi:hypothetical protein
MPAGHIAATKPGIWEYIMPSESVGTLVFSHAPGQVNLASLEIVRVVSLNYSRFPLTKKHPDNTIR